jgi:hypothetical protein
MLKFATSKQYPGTFLPNYEKKLSSGFQDTGGDGQTTDG